MLPLDAYRQWLRTNWADDNALPLSCAIVDYLEKAPNDQLHYITMYTIRSITGKSSNDEELLRAVSILVNTSKPALEMHLMFDDDLTRFEIKNYEYSKAKIDNLLIHPETGEPVEDFESYIYPFFELTQPFIEMKAVSGA